MHFDMSSTQLPAGTSASSKLLSPANRMQTEDKPSPAEQPMLLESESPHVPLVPPVGIVQYVFRTKTSVLLSDACHVCFSRSSFCCFFSFVFFCIFIFLTGLWQEGTFTYEPHVQTNRTKSVLCVPVLNLSRVRIMSLSLPSPLSPLPSPLSPLPSPLSPLPSPLSPSNAYNLQIGGSCLVPGEQLHDRRVHSRAARDGPTP